MQQPKLGVVFLKFLLLINVRGPRNTSTYGGGLVLRDLRNIQWKIPLRKTKFKKRRRSLG